MPLPTLYLENQFGEVSENAVIGGDFVSSSIAANTVLANITGSAAAPAAVTYAALSAKLTPAMLLTGLAVGANSTILAADTVLQALEKLQAQIDALP